MLKQVRRFGAINVPVSAKYILHVWHFTCVIIRGAATDSGPPGQHIHSGPPAFRGGGGGGGVIYYRNRDCVPEPVFFSPSPKLDYTVSAIKIVQFCM